MKTPQDDAAKIRENLKARNDLFHSLRPVLLSTTSTSTTTESTSIKSVFNPIPEVLGNFSLSTLLEIVAE